MVDRQFVRAVLVLFVTVPVVVVVSATCSTKAAAAVQHGTDYPDNNYSNGSKSTSNLTLVVKKCILVGLGGIRC